MEQIQTDGLCLSLCCLTHDEKTIVNVASPALEESNLSVRIQLKLSDSSPYNF